MTLDWFSAQSVNYLNTGMLYFINILLHSHDLCSLGRGQTQMSDFTLDINWCDQENIRDLKWLELFVFIWRACWYYVDKVLLQYARITCT